jgi:DNA-binding response OmpR family regulator
MLADQPAGAADATVTDRPGTVLVVEREPDVAELARLYLRREGYDVQVVTDAARAEGVARRMRPDVVVLDLAVGAHDEFAAAVDAPIVCVVPDGVSAFGPYAVPRPFSPRALVGQVGRALRGEQAAEPPADGVLRVGEIVLDAGLRAVSAAGAHKALTATEFDLLAVLMSRPGRVFSREQLLAAVWGSAESVGTRTVDVHIAQLRAKLGAASPLRTVRGVGYAAGP